MVPAADGASPRPVGSLPSSPLDERREICHGAKFFRRGQRLKGRGRSNTASLCVKRVFLLQYSSFCTAFTAGTTVFRGWAAAWRSHNSGILRLGGCLLREVRGDTKGDKSNDRQLTHGRQAPPVDHWTYPLFSILPNTGRGLISTRNFGRCAGGGCRTGCILFRVVAVGRTRDPG